VLHNLAWSERPKSIIYEKELVLESM